MKTPIVLVILPIFLAITPLVTIAQTFPATPDPGVCAVRAPEDGDIYQLVTEPFEPSGALELSDEEPDPEEVERAIETVVMSIACANANMQMAALSLWTDRYIADHFSTPGGYDELGHLIAASTRETSPAAPEDRLSVNSIGVIGLLVDGRISLEVRTSNLESQYQDIVILADVDGQWLIDDVIPVNETNLLEGTPDSQ